MTVFWETKELGEVAYLAGRIGWKGLTAKEYTTSGPLFTSVHSLNHGDYVDFGEAFHISQERYDESPEIMLEPNDILLCKDGAGIGKVGIVGRLPGPATINSSLLLIRAAEGVYPKFLYYELCSPSFQKIVQERIDGATTPHLYQREIRQFPIPVPSLPEQKRIVTILDEAFAGIAASTANAEKNLANARELFDGYLSSVFDPEKQSVATERLANLVTRLTNGYVGPTRDIYHKSGVPYLLARHVKNNHLKFDGRTFISHDFNEKNRKSILKKGDVLLVQSGHIGHSAVVTDEHHGHNCHAMIVITPVPEKVTGDFLSLYFNSPAMRRKFEEIRSGSTVPHLTCREVREMKIPLPEIAAQKRLVERAQEFRIRVNRLEAIYQRKISALAALKQTILQQAFSGELTALPGVEMQEEAA